MRAPATLVLLTLLSCGSGGCESKGPSPTKHSATKPSAATHAQVATRAPHRIDGPEVKHLLDLSTTAYAAHVFPRDGEVLVVTPALLVRLHDSGDVQKHELDLGRLQVLLGDEIAFLRGDTLTALSLRNLKERTLLRPPEAPRTLVAAGPRLAWSAQKQDGTHLIQTESAGAIVDLYESREPIASPVFRDETIYFLVQAPGGWKVGRAPLNGSPGTLGPVHTSRLPPRLSTGPDGLYYYDGPERGVRRLSFDLSRDEPYAADLICSPLVATTRLICAQVGGVVDVPHQGGEPRRLGSESLGPISGLAATESAAYWIVDRGRDRMSVRMVPLSSP